MLYIKQIYKKYETKYMFYDRLDIVGDLIPAYKVYLLIGDFNIILRQELMYRPIICMKIQR